MTREYNCETGETVGNFNLDKKYMNKKVQFTSPILPSNVRLIGWLDGYHIYAKVDNEDVVDQDGNQKWSNVKEAEDAVKWYIENKTEE